MAAATTIVTAGLQVGSAVKSFSQSKKQQTAATRAQFAADQAMTSAKKELSKNFYSGLDINLKAYDQQRDALAGVADRLVTAGQESERGAAATAGAVLLAANEAEKDITNNQIGAIEALEQSVAKEEGRLAGLRSNLDLAEAQGAQQAAADAEAASNSAMTQGMTSLAGAGSSIAQGAELYGSKGKRNEIDPNDPFRKVSYGDYQNQGGKMNRSDYRNVLGGGSKVGNVLSSVGEAGQGLFNKIGGLFGG